MAHLSTGCKHCCGRRTSVRSRPTEPDNASNHVGPGTDGTPAAEMTTTAPLPPLDSEAEQASQVADAPRHNWVDTIAPASWRPYLRLARADRPVGTWLLLFPCWWSLGLASIADRRPYPDATLLALFALGAFAMRGAGCAYNDYIDREYDAQVARTRSRPIPSGQVSANQALLLVVALGLVGLFVVLNRDVFSAWLAVSSLALVLIYPFMKRLTNWPQLVLGLAFNWGALVGWATQFHSVGWTAIVLYAGCVAWTIGYDTIYAHQDKDDDLMLGLKSTALHFGERTPAVVGLFYLVASALWAVAGFMAGANLISFLALVLVGLHFSWQVGTLDISNAGNCLRRFRSNRDVGFILFGGLVLDMAISWASGLS